MSSQSQIPLYQPPHSFKKEPAEQSVQALPPSTTYSSASQPSSDQVAVPDSTNVSYELRPTIYRPSHYQNFQRQQQQQQVLQERKDSVAPLTVDTDRSVNGDHVVGMLRRP